MKLSYNLMKIIFSYLKEPKLLDLIRHNKNQQRICNKALKNYQLTFLSKFIDAFTYSFDNYDNFFYHYGPFRNFLIDVESSLMQILSFKEPFNIKQKYNIVNEFNIKQKYNILNEIYQNEINLYNSLLKTFNTFSIIEYFFSQNKIKIQLKKTEKIIKKMKDKRCRHRGGRGSRGNRGNRISNGEKELDCEPEEEYEEEYEE